MSDYQKNPFAKQSRSAQKSEPVERMFLFVNRHGKVVPLNDRQAIMLGAFMDEYLGFYEAKMGDDILEKTAEEIRKMDLPRDVKPEDKRKELHYKGKKHYYNKQSEIEDIQNQYG